MLNPNVALSVIGANCDGIDPPPVALHAAAKSANGTTTSARRRKRRQWDLLITPPEPDHSEDPRRTSGENVSPVAVSALGCAGCSRRDERSEPGVVRVDERPRIVPGWFRASALFGPLGLRPRRETRKPDLDLPAIAGRQLRRLGLEWLTGDGAHTARLLLAARLHERPFTCRSGGGTRQRGMRSRRPTRSRRRRPALPAWRHESPPTGGARSTRRWKRTAAGPRSPAAPATRACCRAP